MPELPGPAHSYRDDPAVPAFDDTQAVFVFDGVCVLCSGGASWLMKHDKHGRVRFTPAQEPLGQALYRHYGVDWNESYLLLVEGRAYTASAGYLRLARVLGGIWHATRIAAAMPERWRDALYAPIARHRYRWFGKTGYCALLTLDQRARLL